MKVFVLFAGGLFTFAVVMTSISTAAQSSQSKRELDDRVPAHLPIKIKIKKEKEEGFHDHKNERWASAFELEVKNTGDRPIYALSRIASRLIQFRPLVAVHNPSKVWQKSGKQKSGKEPSSGNPR